MKTKFLFPLILFSLFGLMLVPKSAHAYLDPGTGSMLVQAVIAVIAAVSVSVSVFWRRLRSFLNGILGRNSSKERDSDGR